MEISVLSVGGSKKKPTQIYKRVSKDGSAEDHLNLIKKLKDKKQTFKTVENGVENKYYFNGNNYIIHPKIVK